MATPLRAKALLFDVFGTVVNWEASVTRQLSQDADVQGIDVDWLAFTRQWRRMYLQRTQEIAKTGQGSTNIDVVHYELLEELLQDHDQLAQRWSPTKRKQLALVWHKLDGWPDSSKGLAQLQQVSVDGQRLIVATLSNGSARLLIDLAKHADLRFDAIFSGDLLKSYKPNSKMYLGACEALALDPADVCMVAAHIYDCMAARSFGMKTVYVRRETEDRGNEEAKDLEGKVDYVVDGLDELAGLF